MRLKNGIPAPQSGSMALNTKVVAEQIAHRFLSMAGLWSHPATWPLAANLAYKAGQCESLMAKQSTGRKAIAAMEAQAFVESDLQKLLDCAVTFIPRDSVIARELPISVNGTMNSLIGVKPAARLSKNMATTSLVAIVTWCRTMP
jgi:hypothetical protein